MGSDTHHLKLPPAATSNTLTVSSLVAVTIKDEIKHLEAEMFEIDDLIDGSTKCARNLKQEKTQKMAHLKGLRVAVAPHKILPNETLLEIFSHIREEIQIPPNRHQTKWCIRHVCSSWRSLALNLHSLWSSVSLYTNEIVDELPEKEVKFFWAFKCAFAHYILPKQGPVDINIVIYAEEDQTECFLWDITVKNLLNPLSSRIKSLSAMTTFLPPVSLMRLRGLSFGLLNDVTLNYSSFGIIESQAHTIKSDDLTFFEQAIALRKLSIHGWNYLFRALPPSKIPWSQITHLDLKDGLDQPTFDFMSFTYHELLPHLNQCTSVTHLSLAPTCETITTDLTVDGRLFLPTLRSLVISPRLEEGWCILDLFVTPLLSSLRLKFPCSSGQDVGQIPTQKILSLLCRSSNQYGLLRLNWLPGYGSGEFYSMPDCPYFSQLARNHALLKEIRIMCILNRQDLALLACGELLPNLEILECGFTISPTEFIQIFEPRFPERSGYRLSTNHGKLQELRGHSQESFQLSDIQGYVTSIRTRYSIKLALVPPSDPSDHPLQQILRLRAQLAAIGST